MFKIICGQKLSLTMIFLVVLITGPAEPALAAEKGWDIFGGLMNVFSLLKLLVVIASVVAFIREMFTRRSLLFIIGLLVVATFIYSSYEPDEIRQIGHGIKSLLKLNVNKSDQPQQPSSDQSSQPVPVSDAPNTNQLNNTTVKENQGTKGVKP